MACDLRQKILPTPGTWASIHFLNVHVSIHCSDSRTDPGMGGGELEKVGSDAGLPFPLQAMHLKRILILP